MSISIHHASCGYVYIPADGRPYGTLRIGKLLKKDGIYPQKNQDGTVTMTRIPVEATQESHVLLHQGAVLTRPPQKNRTGAVEMVAGCSKSLSLYDALVVPIEQHQHAAMERVKTIVAPVVQSVMDQFTVGKVQISCDGHGVADITPQPNSKGGWPHSHVHVTFYNCALNPQTEDVQSIRNFYHVLFQEAPVIDAKIQKGIAEYLTKNGIEVELRDNMCHVKQVPLALCEELSPNKHFIERGKQAGLAPDTPGGAQYLNRIARELDELRLDIPKGASVEQAAQVRVEAIRAACIKLNIDPDLLKKQIETPVPNLAPKNGYEAKAQSIIAVEEIAKKINTPLTQKEFEAFVITQSINYPKSTLVDVERAIRSILVRATHEKGPDALDAIMLTYKAPPGSTAPAVETVVKYAPRHVIEEVLRKQASKLNPAPEEPRIERVNEDSKKTRAKPEPEPGPQQEQSRKGEKQEQPKPNVERDRQRSFRNERSTDVLSIARAMINAWTKFFTERFRTPKQVRILYAGDSVQYFIHTHVAQSVKRSHGTAIKEMIRHFFRMNDPHKCAEHGEKVYDRCRSFERLREGAKLVVHDPLGKLSDDDRYWLSKIAKRDGATVEYVEPTIVHGRGQVIDVTPVKERSSRKPNTERHSEIPPPPPPPPPSKER